MLLARRLRDDPARHAFWHSLRISFLLALETIAICLLLFVPTIYWVHLKVPRLRPVIAFLALIPFVVPPIIMVVGLLNFYKGTPTGSTQQPGASSSPRT